MIRVTPQIQISEHEIEEHFVHASGPGGQNVNKVATAVQLRFDVKHSPSLPADVAARAAALAGHKLTREGVIVITAHRFRSQERNRADALARLVALLRQAATRPKPRRPTGPSKAAVERRLRQKTRRGELKRTRRAGFNDH